MQQKKNELGKPILCNSMVVIFEHGDTVKVIAKVSVKRRAFWGWLELKGFAGTKVSLPPWCNFDRYNCYEIDVCNKKFVLKVEPEASDMLTIDEFKEIYNKVN